MIKKALAAVGIAALMSSFGSCNMDNDSDPMGLTAKIVSATSIALDWSGHIDASFTLYRDEERIYSGSTSKYTDTNLDPGTRYKYQVKETYSVKNHDGNYETRNVSSWSLYVTTPSLSAALNLNAEATSATAIRITWKAIPDITSYELQIAVDRNSSGWLQQKTSIRESGLWNNDDASNGILGLVVTGFSPDTEYYFRLRCTERYRDPYYSLIVSATTPADEM